MTMVIAGMGRMLAAIVASYRVVDRGWPDPGAGSGRPSPSSKSSSNRDRRAWAGRSTALIFSALGAVLGIWLGLWLTTPATPLPLGLPFAVASPDFEYGWRVMYLIGGLLALVGVLLRFQLPE